MAKEYQEVMEKLEGIIANDLDNNKDYELVEEINSLIVKIENGHFD